MKTALILTLLGCALASVALAQQPPTTQVPPPPPAGVAPPPPTPGTTEPESPPPAVASETPETAPQDTQGARETPLDTEAFDVRVHHRLDEYNQRREQRELEMASYNKASGNDPGLERFADPRKVQVELKDELDREQTSEQLANDYAEQAREVLGKQQAIQDFIAKRRKTLDDLSKQNVGVNPQDLEVALANLAHQPDSPETEAQMREIDRRLRPSVLRKICRPGGLALRRKRQAPLKHSPSSRLSSSLTRKSQRPSRPTRSRLARTGWGWQTGWNITWSAPRQKTCSSKAAKPRSRCNTSRPAQRSIRRSTAQGLAPRRTLTWSS